MVVALTTVAPIVTSNVSVPAVPVTPDMRGSVADACAESDNAIKPHIETASNAIIARLKHFFVLMVANEIIVSRPTAKTNVQTSGINMDGKRKYKQSKI